MKKYAKWVLLVLLVAWCITIWQFSMAPAEKSSGTSSQVQDFCNDVLDKVGVDATVSAKTVRKTAHFSEFMLLGALAVATLFAHGFGHWLLLSPLVFAPAAIVDECIQIFVPGRGPAILDVLLDVAGGTFGAAVFWALITLLLYIKNKREKIEKTT